MLIRQRFYHLAYATIVLSVLSHLEQAIIFLVHLSAHEISVYCSFTSPLRLCCVVFISIEATLLRL